MKYNTISILCNLSMFLTKINNLFKRFFHIHQYHESFAEELIRSNRELYAINKIYTEVNEELVELTEELQKKIRFLEKEIAFLKNDQSPFMYIDRGSTYSAEAK
jgi:uncharacterized protein YaaN involved in tellurite resistance